ncbi:MAG: hypothetical protein B6A08_04610 [Sorangiineae bacterium NIC37A_2]|nr:MAG: hypothetical protein B6A08_04610 [Sorangiineae bacterium NIC37A_2]
MSEDQPGFEQEAPVPSGFGGQRQSFPPDPGTPSMRITPESTRLSVSMFEPDALAPLFFAVLFACVTFGTIYVLLDFVADAVLAFVLVGLSHRLYETLRRRLNNRAILAAMLVTVFVATVIIGPISMLAYTIGIEASSAFGSLAATLTRSSSELVDKLVAGLAEFHVPVSRQLVLEVMNDLSSALQRAAVEWGGAILENALRITVHLIIVLILVFYTLIDGHRLKTFLFDLSPLPDDEDELLIQTFQKVSRGVVVGNGLGSVIQGVLGGIAMAIAGLPSPVLWGGVMSFFAFLPLVGISLVVIPASVFLFFDGRPGTALAFFLFCSIQGIFVENVVKTRLMGSAMRMHDVLVFLSILGGITSFGVIGLVYGPLIAMLFSALAELYHKRYRRKLALQLGPRKP